MKRRSLGSGAAVSAAGILIANLAACGGGGDGGSAGGGPSAAPLTVSPGPGAATYSGAALVGELITFTIDTASLAYSYTIVESQFGLAGRSSSGTLIRNPDGTFRGSGLPDAQIVVLPDGVLLAAVRENFGSGLRTVPVLAVRDPHSALAAGAGTYNYVARGCPADLCATDHGSLRIDADATWSACSQGNVATGCDGGAAGSGTLNALGNGRWQMIAGGAQIGTLMMAGGGDSKFAVVDLRDLRANGLGRGILVAAAQRPVSPASTAGNWVAGGSNGNWATLEIDATQIRYTSLNRVNLDATLGFNPNHPW
ncbi:MAG TPA: hypothetical protein VM491_00575, partial [Burkholderiaceae bacterium]|nr:hypothetical protein [Burkholderiaceae bacterium]